MTRPYETVRYEARDRIATITLDRPAARNAFNLRMRDELYEVLSAVRDDPEIRVVVFRGRGRGFCSGGDLTEFGTAPSPLIARDIRRRRDVWGLLANSPKLTLAAVHGDASGSGFELALFCDFRVAALDARFSLPETGLGLIPGAGGTQTIARHLGLGRALEAVLSGRVIRAREAHRMGLVGEVAPRTDLARVARRTARRLARVEPRIARAIRSLVWAGLDLPLEMGLTWERRTAGEVSSLLERTGR